LRRPIDRTMRAGPGSPPGRGIAPRPRRVAAADMSLHAFGSAREHARALPVHGGFGEWSLASRRGIAPRSSRWQRLGKFPCESAPPRGNLYRTNGEPFTAVAPQSNLERRFGGVKGLARFLSKRVPRCPGRFAQPFPPAWSFDSPGHRGTGRCLTAPAVSLPRTGVPARPQGSLADKDDAAGRRKRKDEAAGSRTGTDDAAGSRTGPAATAGPGAGTPIHAAARSAAYRDEAAGSRTGPATTAGSGAGWPIDVAAGSAAGRDDAAGSRRVPP
jgi:hypothetical protein